MPDEAPKEPHETEEELEERLRKLLGEGALADSEELGEIELKLRDIDSRFADQHESRQEKERLSAAELKDGLKNLHVRAEGWKVRTAAQSAEKKRQAMADVHVAKGLGLGLTVAYTIIGVPLAGLAVGWVIDHYAGTTTAKGIGMLIGAGIGMAMALFILKRSSEDG